MSSDWTAPAVRAVAIRARLIPVARLVQLAEGTAWSQDALATLDGTAYATAFSECGQDVRVLTRLVRKVTLGVVGTILRFCEEPDARIVRVIFADREARDVRAATRACLFPGFPMPDGSSWNKPAGFLREGWSEGVTTVSALQAALAGTFYAAPLRELAASDASRLNPFSADSLFDRILFAGLARTLADLGEDEEDDPRQLLQFRTRMRDQAQLIRAIRIWAMAPDVAASHMCTGAPKGGRSISVGGQQIAVFSEIAGMLDRVGVQELAWDEQDPGALDRSLERAWCAFLASIRATRPLSVATIFSVVEEFLVLEAQLLRIATAWSLGMPVDRMKSLLPSVKAA